MTETQVGLKAKISVNIEKIDHTTGITTLEQHEVELSGEEAQQLWQSQMQH
jgi:hypothetical protein